MTLTIYYRDGFTEEFDDVRKIENDHFGYDPVIEYVTFDKKHGTLKKVRCTLDIGKVDNIYLSL